MIREYNEQIIIWIRRYAQRSTFSNSYVVRFKAICIHLSMENNGSNAKIQKNQGHVLGQIKAREHPSKPKEPRRRRTHRIRKRGRERCRVESAFQCHDMMWFTMTGQLLKNIPESLKLIDVEKYHTRVGETESVLMWKGQYPGNKSLHKFALSKPFFSKISKKWMSIFRLSSKHRCRCWRFQVIVIEVIDWRLAFRSPPLWNWRPQ